MDTEKRKFTDTQLRIIQIVTGTVSAIVLFLSLYLPRFFVTDQNSLLNYVFVVVFLVIMMGRRSIENKYRLRLNLYSLALMDGILAAIIIFAGMGLYAKNGDPMANLDNTVKILIICGLTAVLLGLGIAFPLVRYMKRKANGTLAPIRIPEKPEPTEEELKNDPNRPLTLEEKIAAMSEELGDTNSDKVSETRPEESEKE